MKTFSMNEKRIKNICNLIDKYLNYPYDIEVLKGYCLGFVMAVFIFSDIDIEAAKDLNNYVKIKSDIIKEKSQGVH